MTERQANITIRNTGYRLELPYIDHLYYVKLYKGNELILTSYFTRDYQRDWYVFGLCDTLLKVTNVID